jgi:GTPase SAR1 family protein
VIEFWDVGGHRNYQDARSVFYNNINGIILVHDLSNKKSLLHLKNWLDELVKEDLERKSKGHRGIEENYYVDTKYSGHNTSTSGGGGNFSIAHRPMLHTSTHRSATTTSTSNNYGNSPDSRVGGSGGGLFGGLPILVVGNKSDLLPRSIPASSFEHRFEHVHTNTIDFTTDLNGKEKFASFFNRVIERRYGT